MTTEPIKRIPARYIGSHPVIVQGGAIDLQGKRIGGLLQYGDVILMPEREVKGQTLFRQNDQLFDLGVGRVVRKEDQGKSNEELAALGYDFHDGRADFSTIDEPTTGENSTVEEQTREEIPEGAIPAQPETSPISLPTQEQDQSQKEEEEGRE